MSEKFGKRKHNGSALDRVLGAAGVGGGLGTLAGALGGGPKAAIKEGLRGALVGGGGMAIGDAIVGGEPEGGFGEMGRGALGGAIAGGALNTIEVGSKKGGMGLVHWLMQNKGLSKNAAMLAVLGAGAAVGGGMGALHGAGSAGVASDLRGEKPY